MKSEQGRAQTPALRKRSKIFLTCKDVTDAKRRESEWEKPSEKKVPKWRRKNAAPLRTRLIRREGTAEGRYQLWPSEVWPRRFAKIGQTKFGQHQVWPIPSLARSCFQGGESFWPSGRSGWGPRRGGRPNPEKWGP